MLCYVIESRDDDITRGYTGTYTHADLELARIFLLCPKRGGWKRTRHFYYGVASWSQGQRMEDAWVLIFFVLFRRYFDLALSSSQPTVLSMELESIGSGTKGSGGVDGGREANVGIQSRNMDQRCNESRARSLLMRDEVREGEGGRWKNLMKLLDERTGGLLACLRSLESGIGFAHWIRYFRLGQRDRYSSHVVNIPRPRPGARSGIESRQA